MGLSDYDLAALECDIESIRLDLRVEAAAEIRSLRARVAEAESNEVIWSSVADQLKARVAELEAQAVDAEALAEATGAYYGQYGDTPDGTHYDSDDLSDMVKILATARVLMAKRKEKP